MIYIIGVRHDLQCIKSKDSHLAIKFQRKLYKLCNKLNIQIIVEEYNEEARKQNYCDKLVCENICTQLNIVHEFCEPDNETRKQLGILGDNGITEQHFFKDWTAEELKRQRDIDFTKRENYWLEIISNFQPINKKNIILICGKKHVSRIKSKLKDNLLDCGRIKYKYPPLGAVSK